MAAVAMVLAARVRALMPPPAPYQPPDMVRRAAAIAAGPQLVPTAGAPGGGCGGRCAHPSASAATPAVNSPLVITGSETPTSGPLQVNALPNPADVAGDFKTPPPAGTPASAGKDNAVWLWLAVIVVLLFVLSEGKGGRKLW